ncbi:SUMF1/EgtB/PvdO family nonheme iron enzyme [Polyangium sp. 6x1]|uniref:formylglycine-generating enzyme family protein n=1 Tax=Polyangium sp. 6x1 TaxID=3042689 RepID=UPI002482FD07|nr:SUMF1/EgtB/PvdO family nonheme iron enzyme [Polyangium sp. 6x1]MDI1449085.1 SUMF1/EgtB/PvdO family nonheme iron enzyme [Polyangium sp. 6x1]
MRARADRNAGADVREPSSSMYPGDDGYPSTASVGRFPKGASPFGVLDMAGNVSEWTASGYSSNYAEKPGTAQRVFRGGSWFDYVPRDERLTLRLRSEPEMRLSWLGFRCAGRSALP